MLRARYSIATIIAVLAPVVGTSAEPPGAADLRGVWRVVSVTGGDGAYDAFQQADLVFLGDRFVVVPNGSTGDGPATVYRFRLGARRPVQEFNFYHQADARGSHSLGVYEVKGNTLRLCLSAETGTRPTSLRPGKRQALLVAQRIEE